MKLSKLYCNDERFKNITFNLNGLNVIYADVKAKVYSKKNSHDLGKTLLAKLIDFLLLKEVKNQQKHFLFKLKDSVTGLPKFEDYIFYLELQLNSGKFLTIKRSITSNTKISFKENHQTVNNFQPPTNWDCEDESIRNAKEILADYLAYSFFTNKDYDFRKAINYSLRMQGDYGDVYRLSKFTGPHLYWKPFMFDLLGFKGNLLAKKYEHDAQVKETEDFVKKLKKEYGVNVDERDEIVARINLKTNQVNSVTGQIDQFNFYEQDQALIDNGVNEIEVKISNLNSLTYNLEYEINRLRDSIQNNFSFDLNKIKKVFEEANLFFPENLKHDYAALLKFNNKLTAERNKLLKTTLIERTEELRDISQQLQILNKKREDLLSYLQDTEVFEKFKYLQKGLVEVQSELLKLQGQLAAIDSIIQKQNQIKELKDEIESTVEELKSIYQQTEKNIKYSNIRTLFSSYYKEIMNEDAILSWKLNTSENVEFNPPKIQAQTVKREETAKDEGKTYKKLLCVSFDLAILIAYNKEPYFRFVYHDDVLSQQDNGIKSRLLELVHRLIVNYDLQYILSIIKADLPTNEAESPIYFSDEEIILKLHDKDETGTLFGFEF